VRHAEQPRDAWVALERFHIAELGCSAKSWCQPGPGLLKLVEPMQRPSQPVSGSAG